MILKNTNVEETIEILQKIKAEKKLGMISLDGEEMEAIDNSIRFLSERTPVIKCAECRLLKEEMLEVIDGNNIIIRFDGVRESSVYTGFLHELKDANLNWNVDEEIKMITGNGDYLTLNEIAEQCEHKIITVFVEEPLGGCIYQYGNYGDAWYRIGKLAGYA